MTAISFDDLIKLERAAVAAHQAAKDTSYSAEAWKPWFDAAHEFQLKVTQYAKEEGTPRVEIEMRVKKAIRHPAPAEAA